MKDIYITWEDYHKKIEQLAKKIFDDRLRMNNGEIPINWGYAETMAYATLLDEGYPIRLTGQDVRRGTFSHRHACVFDSKNGMGYIPLSDIAEQNKSTFDIYDSLLSEEAVLAFEYGYSATWPSGLAIWEAQFGDFANGAQVVIDQFIVSAQHKWERLSGLVMLLPHGYEGQGPEHSSARIERFLQLCASENIQVCVPSSPKQIFHLLRRQAIRKMRTPLVVISPFFETPWKPGIIATPTFKNLLILSILILIILELVCSPSVKIGTCQFNQDLAFKFNSFNLIQFNLKASQTCCWHHSIQDDRTSGRSKKY